MKPFIAKLIISTAALMTIVTTMTLGIGSANAETRTNCYDYGSSIDCTDDKGARITGWKYGDNNTEWTHSDGTRTSCWNYGSNNTECTNSKGGRSSGWKYGDNNVEWTHSNGTRTSCWKYGKQTDCTTR